MGSAPAWDIPDLKQQLIAFSKEYRPGASHKHGEETEHQLQHEIKKSIIRQKHR